MVTRPAAAFLAILFSAQHRDVSRALALFFAAIFFRLRIALLINQTLDTSRHVNAHSMGQRNGTELQIIVLHA